MKIFIGGHRKCGTTLFLNLLDSHPQLVVYPQDVHIFYAYYPLFTENKFTESEQLERLDTVIFKSMLKRWRQERWVDRLNIEKMQTIFLDNISKHNLNDIGSVLEAQLTAFKIASNNNSSVDSPVVIKETSIEIYAEYLLNRFPESKFIHILRDPRDNYAALKSGIIKRYQAFNDDENTILCSMIHRYGLGMKLAKLNEERFGPDRYKIIKHESVTQNTESILREVCEFLNIDFKSSLLHPTLMGKPTIGNCFEQIDMSKISGININRWQERISEQEACVIEFHFKELMQQHGYNCKFSESEQADAASEFYKWSNYKYHYFDHFKDQQQC